VRFRDAVPAFDAIDDRVKLGTQLRQLANLREILELA
jgi:hypothetical protein